MSNYFVAAVGWALLLFGLAGFGIEIDKLTEGESTSPALGFVLASLFTLGGFAVVRHSRQTRHGESDADVRARLAKAEQAVFDVARMHAGVITATQVAAGSQLSFLEAEQELERLASHAACEADIDEDGTLVYRFRGLLPKGD